MRRPGKPGLVILVVVALLASQLAGLHLAPASHGVSASGDSRAGAVLASGQAVGPADTSDDQTATAIAASATAAEATAEAGQTATAAAATAAAETATASVATAQAGLTATYQALETAVIETATAAAATVSATPISSAQTQVQPPQGPPGTPVAIVVPYGTFTPNTALTLYFIDPLNSNPPQQLATATSDGAGGLTLSNIMVPSQATVGTGAIRVIASNGTTVDGMFSVTPIIVANPATVPPGGTTQVTGDGFAAFNSIKIVLNGVDVTSSAAPQPATDHLGHFVTTLSIPATQVPGLSALQASDPLHASPQIQLTIGTAPATTPVTATVSPTVTGVVNTPTFLPTAPARTLTPTPGVPGAPTTPSAPGGATSAYFAEGYTGTAAINKTASFTETLNILNPSTSAAPVTITYYILGSATPRKVTKTVPAASVLRESVNGDVGPDKQVAAVVTSSQRVYVVRAISRTTPKGQRLDGSSTPPARAPATTWSFAEGYTGVTFQEYLTLLNTNTVTATVTVKLVPQASSATGAKTLTVQVPPLSRATENIRALTTGNSARSVGMLISSTQPIVAERVMYFGNGSGSGKFGSTVTSGLPAASANLVVGYGSSGGTTAAAGGTANATGDQEFITIINPNIGGSVAHVSVGFHDASGRATGNTVAIDVPPGTRQTVIANNALGKAAVSPVSVSLSATGSTIQAEAAQYYGGSPNVGNHPGIALPALATPTSDAFLSDLSVRLADGSAVNRSVFLYNPTSVAISITATYYGSNGATAQKTYAVAPGGITTVNVNQDTPSTFAANPIGAQFRSAGAGTFFAYAIGRTTDNLSAIEEVATAAS